jgi:hypothetical protein
MSLAFQAVALLSAGLFTGGALYVSLVEHPARMALELGTAVQQFRSSYRRAAPWQAAMAILCAVCGVVASLAGASRAWGIGGLMVGVAVPFTLIVIMPINKRLLTAEAAEAARVSRANELLRIRARLALEAAGEAVRIFLQRATFGRDGSPAVLESPAPRADPRRVSFIVAPPSIPRPWSRACLPAAHQADSRATAPCP